MRAVWANSERSVGNLIEEETGHIFVIDQGSENFEFFLSLDPEDYQEPVSETDYVSLVNEERDRRLKLSFPFMGKMIQRDDVSLRRIQGAAQMATLAIISGTDPNSLQWVNGQPLYWITEDNSTLMMSPAMTVAMGQAAAVIETRLVFAARSLKAMDPIPLDYASDVYWEEQQ